VSIFPEEITKAASQLLEDCRGGQVRLATAESCTGGLLAAALTSIAGSSDVFERGFVTYSNQAKIELLGVSAETLSTSGAVSRETAAEMLQGIFRNSNTDLGISITGVAGPDGGSSAKPVGLVHMAVGRRGEPAHSHEFRFPPVSRNAIQLDAVAEALRLLTARAANP
jgi:nicotinamide-nucleotide amidase